MLERVITGLRVWFADAVVGFALATVAFCTGFISYTHICALTLNEDQSWKTAHLMPLAIDGQIVIGSAYFMAHDDKRRWWGLIGIVPGVLESLFANWESGIVHGLWAAGWATVPAQAFACSTFLFERWLKSRRTVHPAVQEDVQPHVPETVQPVVEQPAGTGTGWPESEPQRPRLLPPPQDAEDARLELPEDEAGLRELVLSASPYTLNKTHKISKHRARQLREQYENESKAGENVA